MKITTPEEEKKEEVAIAKKKAVVKKVIEKPKTVTKKKAVPLGYTKVVLDSLGKLTAPFELHFRDYSMEEVLELASTKDDIDNLETIVKVLNSMLLEEDFDCEDFTHEELMETLYTIQGSFYSTSIERRVKIDETKPNNDVDNYTYASISLGDIDTIELSEEFKEPFTLTDSKTKQKFTFRLPRVKDKLTAETYLRNKYKLETRKFSSIHQALYKIERIRDNEARATAMEALEETRYDDIEEYREYIISKTKLMLILTQGLSLLSIDGEELEYGDCDKLLEVIPTISRRVWETYTSVSEKYTYGLDENVTFYLPEVEDKVTRRLPFQRVDFLPDHEKEGDTGVDISFD